MGRPNVVLCKHTTPPVPTPGLPRAVGGRGDLGESVVSERSQDRPRAWPRGTKGRFDTPTILPEATSTNEIVASVAAEGEPEGTVVIADYQSAGRGRLGRRWEAPPGSALACSALIRPKVEVDLLPLCGLAAGIAMVEVIERLCGLVVGLKWPNDLLVGDAKLGGILAEIVAPPVALHRPTLLDPAVVVGIGVNLHGPLAPSLAASATTLADQVGSVPTRDEIASEYLEGLDIWISSLERNGTGPLIDVYRQRCATLGRRVSAHLADRSLGGIACDVDDHGRLLLSDDSGELIAISAGDLEHIRATTGP